MVFKSTSVTAPLNPALWSVWQAAEPNTDHVTYADYDTSGSGVPSNVERPSFASLLTKTQAADYTMSEALSGQTKWIDTDYLL